MRQCEISTPIIVMSSHLAFGGCIFSASDDAKIPEIRHTKMGEIEIECEGEAER